MKVLSWGEREDVRWIVLVKGQGRQMCPPYQCVGQICRWIRAWVGARGDKFADEQADGRNYEIVWY